MNICAVAIPGLEQPYSYQSTQPLPRGSVVEVPLGRSSRRGFVLGPAPQPDQHLRDRLRPIERVYEHLRLHENQIALAQWLASYYCGDLGSYLQLMAPFSEQVQIPRRLQFVSTRKLRPNASRLRALCEQVRQGSITDESQIPRAQLQKLLDAGALRYRNPAEAEDPYAPHHTAERLTDQQRDVHQQILHSDRPALLEGVTGSGKTEIYMAAIDDCLSRGKSAIYLVPEISLTPALIDRIRRTFGPALALIHSRIARGQRALQHQRILRGELRLVLGARSAIFAPVRELGLIIVDEEHDSSYYQSEHPVYNARDLAVLRASRDQAQVILGSATPSLESRYNAQQGKYLHLHLHERFGGVVPQIQAVSRPANKAEPLGTPVLQALEQTLQHGRQAIVFLNRRGFAPYALCQSCQEPIKCPNCDVSLTYHKARNRLRCHYCEYSASITQRCHACGSHQFAFLGHGTQKLEELLAERFARYGVSRIDRDSASSPERLESLIEPFLNGDAQLLTGTQMIAKGHDFPNVDLVAVVGIDNLLNLPDFRASERSYQLLVQIAGRAGRWSRNIARVMVQTDFAELPAIDCAIRDDQHGFYRQELQFRKSFGYPPYQRLAAVLFQDANRERAIAAARNAADACTSDHNPSVRMLGPTPGALEQVRGRYVWKILLRADTRRQLEAPLQIIRNQKLPSSTRRRILVDPLIAL